MIIITKKNDWNNLIEQNFLKKKDVYYKFEYFDLYKQFYNVKPEGIYFEDDNLEVFWTHLIRDIGNIVLFRDFQNFDLATPYGFGGPLINVKTDNQEKLNKSIQTFFNEYLYYSKQQNYISEFIRFHPLFNQYDLINNYCKILYMYDLVAVNLRQSYEMIWKNMTKKK